MAVFVKIWKCISMLGVLADMPYFLKKRFVLSNRISFVYAVTLLIGAVVFACKAYQYAAFTASLLATIALGTLMLNKSQKLALSSLIFCLIQPIIFVLSTMLVRIYEKIDLDLFTYYFPCFVLMSWVVFPLILFDIRQKYQIALSIIVIGFVLFAYDSLHQLFHILPSSTIIDAASRKIINITQLVSIALFSLGFVFLQRINQIYQRKIETLLDEVHKTNEELEESSTFLEEAMEELMASNNEVHLQKQQIEAQNEFLTDVNKELINAQYEIEVKNQQLQSYNEKLEGEVEERTLRLMLTNSQLLSANRELDTFIYRASHDLMGPIVTLKGLSNLALIDQENTGQYVDRFRTNIDVMHYRLSQLLQMLSIKDAEVTMKKINLHKIVQNTFTTLNPSVDYPNVQIIQHIPKDLFLISDEAMLQLVLEHVLRNAFQYSKNNHDTSWVSVEVASDEFTTCIHIKDNGIGISEESGPRIFDMFYRGTEQSKGAGLGLYVSKKAVEKLSGDIAWESNKTQTTFSILLAQKTEIVEHHQQDTENRFVEDHTR